MKKITALLLIVMMASAFCACGVNVEWGPRVESNVARVYTTGDRLSSFVINGVKVEGSVPGSASMDNSADGRTSLADVDNSVVYFVSENGVDQLGSAIFSEEISFDGRTAVYLDGTNVMRYSADTREKSVLLEGMAAVSQLAISPHGQTVAVTGSVVNEGTEISTFIVKNGVSEKVLEQANCAIIAIADDGSVYYYINRDENKLYAVKNGEEKLVTGELGAASVFNFTSDLSELCYYTSSGVNRLFDIETGSDRELCSGFGYTAKTNVYSISWGDHPVYINDVETFLNGLFLCRSSSEGGYMWNLGVLRESGIEWITENAETYSVIEDKGQVIWLSSGVLMRTKLSGKTKILAENVLDMAVTDTGDIYYRTNANSLFLIRGGAKGKKLDSSVNKITVCGRYCFYIKDKPVGGGAEAAGKLFRTDGKTCEDMQVGACTFEKREGHLLVYADPVKDGDGTLCRLLFTHDGESFTAEFEGVRQ